MDGPAGDFGDEPTLIPARMLNEFVYCPRLFYLEWVDRLWADSHDTVQGHMAHDANDRRGGRMPPPAAVDPPRATAQVEISDAEIRAALNDKAVEARRQFMDKQ